VACSPDGGRVASAGGDLTRSGSTKAPVVTSEELQTRKKGAKPEAQLDSRELYKGKIFTLNRDTVRFPDGTSAEMDVCRHPGAAAIVPFLSDPQGDEPQILMLRQYRYAAGGYLYEIPAGRLDDGELPLACAARELKEETGCTAERIEALGGKVTSGLSKKTDYLVVGTSPGTIPDSVNGKSELAEIYLLADPEVDGSPELWEAHVLAAAEKAGINLAACADISVLDHAMHGRDAERVHRAVHGYVALHPACGGHLRVARRLDVSIVEPNAVSLIAWGSGLLKQAVGPVDSTVAVTGYGG
jgi:ADP-ribose pyrophosphatase